MPPRSEAEGAEWGAPPASASPIPGICWRSGPDNIDLETIKTLAPFLAPPAPVPPPGEPTSAPLGGPWLKLVPAAILAGGVAEAWHPDHRGPLDAITITRLVCDGPDRSDCRASLGVRPAAAQPIKPSCPIMLATS